MHSAEYVTDGTDHAAVITSLDDDWRFWFTTAGTTNSSRIAGSIEPDKNVGPNLVVNPLLNSPSPGFSGSSVLLIDKLQSSANWVQISEYNGFLGETPAGRSAISILFYSSNLLGFECGCHFGRIATPLVSGGENMGLDGLGMLGNFPGINTSTVSSRPHWITRGGSTSRRRIRTSPSGSGSWTFPRLLAGISESSTNEFQKGKILMPIMISPGGNARTIYMLDHIFYWDSTQTSLNFILNEQGEKFQFLDNSTSSIVLRYEFGVQTRVTF